MPKKQPPLYLTTAIAYVNGAPHMGHAMEFIYADAIARASRLFGREVRFQIGTDEHGVKIYETAQKENKDVAGFVRDNRQKYFDLKEKLNLSYDEFVHTADNEAHKKASQKLWNALLDAGKLEEREYEGLYCKGCEAFVLEKDLIDGKCAIHEQEPIKVKEKNWFFKLSESTDEIKTWINDGAIIPEFRKKELLNLMEDGLMDVSFSRPKTSLPWGIDVPNDHDQVMYVWCDALTNYITGLGYAKDEEEKMFRDWWGYKNDPEDKRSEDEKPEIVHVIGKDILRFHAAYWPAMLSNAGLKKPDHILVHGFVTSEGKKMSKSLGNVVSPDDICEKYSADVLRWYLLSEMPLGQDGDFSWNRISEKYTGELANKIGNLASRIGMLVEKKLDGRLSGGMVGGYQEKTKEILSPLFDVCLGKFDMKNYSEIVLMYFDRVNEWTDHFEPWNKNLSEGDIELALNTLAYSVYAGAIVLSPLMPDISKKILSQFDMEMPDTFEEALETMPTTMKKGEILFPKLEE